MISVCVTVKNRSRVPVQDRELTLFPNCVGSLACALSSPRPVPSELVVADWHSDDWPLSEWLERAAAPLPVRLVQLDGEFNRGRGRNAAAAAAQGETLFFLDADCTVSSEVIQCGLQALAEGKAFFPVLFSFNDPDHKTGYWRHAGYGNCMLRRSLFEAVKGWPVHAGWGKEDTGFHTRVRSHAAVAREEVPGFCHQWHPDDVVWKDRYTRRAPYLEEERRQIESAASQLGTLIPEGQHYILVDEARFGNSLPPNRPAFPFLEKDGQYWGAPSDDSAAVSEFERLRQKGASFIAFAWMTFWWLEFYQGFHRHLRSRFPCVLENDQLVVFDLRTPQGGAA